MKRILSLILSFIIVISAFSAIIFVKNDISVSEDNVITEVDVYFIAGQSNAAGFSYFSKDVIDPTTNDRCLNVSMNISDNRITAYKNGFENVLYMGRADFNYCDKLKPVTIGMGVDKYQIGAELGIAEVLEPIYKGSNKKAVIIKYALGGSSIIGLEGSYFGNWCAPSYNAKHNVTVAGENLYDEMVGTPNESYTDGYIWKAFTKLYYSGYTKINLKGLLWAQGEAECNDFMHTKHQEGFECFISDFRADLKTLSIYFMKNRSNLDIADSANLSFLISEVCPSFAFGEELEDHTSSNAYINSVISQQREIAKNDENVYTMTTHEYLIKEDKIGMASLDRTKSYCNDMFHYNADDMISIGNRAASIMYNF